MKKRFDLSDIRRTMRYMKRNGFRDTYFAAKERLKMRAGSSYSYVCPDVSELKRQTEETKDLNDASGIQIWPLITMVMPAYNTPEDFFRQAVDSVVSQSYPHWKLIICDASDDEAADLSRPVFESYTSDPRITYLKIDENRGISENTNAGIEAAIGAHESGISPTKDPAGKNFPAYIGFLDHDDVLAPDALYHLACAIVSSRKTGTDPAVLYSDEDKMEQSGESDLTFTYFAPHRKYDFNYDLLLTNNYICHLMLIRSDILDNIRFRSKYDGAQDYDLVLQAVRYLAGLHNATKDVPDDNAVSIPDLGRHIIHVPHVLYHWRSHKDSTASNTESKRYAYEAGLQALTEHVNLMHGSADKDANLPAVSVSHSKHLGFYDIDWGVKYGTFVAAPVDYTPLFTRRPDIGAVIGRVIDLRGQMISCIRDEHGNSLYAGLNKNYAGEFNRFDCAQDVYLADIKYVTVRPELDSLLKDSPDSESFARSLRDRGYLIYYDPSLKENP